MENKLGVGRVGYWGGGMDRDKQVDAAIFEASLLVSAPEHVFTSLSEYEKATNHIFSPHSSEAFEAALLSRNSPLIDLGLARHAAEGGTIAALFERGLSAPSGAVDKHYRKGLRIACLSNKNTRYLFASDVPLNWLSKERLAKMLAVAEVDEVGALLSNPALSGNLIEKILLRKEPFEGLPEERWMLLVNLLAQNARFGIDESNEHGPDLQHMCMHGAILNLLQIAPTTLHWVRSLYHLLQQLKPHQVASPKSTQVVGEILERWTKVDVPVPKKSETQREGGYSEFGGYYTELSLVDEFRCLIAALYGRAFTGKEFVNYGSAESPDVTMRAAYYGGTDLSDKQMTAAYQKDRALFSFAAMFNDSVFRTTTTRALFEGEMLSGHLIHVYRRRCQQLAAQWKWFNPAPTTEWVKEATSESDDDESPQDLARQEEIKSLERKLAQVSDQLKALRSAAIWGAVVLGALILWR